MQAVPIVIMALSVAASEGAAAPCQPQRLNVEIVDEGARSARPASAAEAIQDPHFKQFVMTLTDHFRRRIGAGGARPEAGELTLVFIRRPLTREAGAPDAPGADRLDGAVLLESPWVRVAAAAGCRLRAVFSWSERQLLLDQAALAGAGVALKQPSPSVREADFERYAADYAESVITNPSADGLAALSGRVPPDLLWLFRRSPQSTRGLFSSIAAGSVARVGERIARPYAAFTAALADQALAGQGGKRSYSSILDAKDLLGPGFIIERLQ